MNIEDQHRGPPQYVAAQKVLTETIRPLNAELTAELAAWLRAKDGFWDNMFKRCAGANPIFGLHLVTEWQGVQQDIEIVVDFVCNRMTVLATEGRGRIWTELHFDHSRSALLSILRRGLPNDAELRKLQ